MADLLNLSLHIFTIPFFLILATLVACNGSNNEFESCSTLISCGKLENVGYPFWGLGRPSYCGHPALQLHCQSNDYPWINGDHGVRYYVHSIQYSSSSLKTTIQLQEYSNINSFNNFCPFHPIDNDLKEVFQLSETVVKMYLFYDCPKTNGSHGSITCRYEHRSIKANYLPKPDDDQFKYCKFVAVPVLAKELNFLNSGEGKIQDVLKQGYEVDYLYSSACFTCQDYGGICGSSIDKKFVCFPKHHKSGQRKLIIGLAIAGAFLMLLVLNVSICCCMKPKFHSPKLLSKTLSYIRMNSDIETGSSFHGIPIFSYSELQEATNNFSVNQELGHGGFGIVYQGKLRDGREVAVKRLYEKNYKQIGQFINEIEIFTRLHHNNLVKLHGCTTRHSRELLLVYEFIPNGTVDDHLHGNRKESGILSWDMRMKIATESASALSYLHASDIIHRDVKTNNILLDNHFSVKVADFGLSRLFPFETTHVSTAPQGTPGYLDPDYNKCYQVTNKSDVYSFGVVLVKLISSLPAVDISRQEDEINLSDYAMNRIQHGRLNELVDHDLGFESDFKVNKMITLVAEVAFQCLQQNKELRPSMDEVLNALKQIESMDYYSQETEQNPSREISKQTSMPRGKNVSAPSTNFKHLPSPNSVIENWNSKSSASHKSTQSS